MELTSVYQGRKVRLKEYIFAFTNFGRNKRQKKKKRPKLILLLMQSVENTFKDC